MMMDLKNRLHQNKNENGGGLATNITGRFESNRHAIAKIEKYTFGQVVKELKKLKIKTTAKDLLAMYRSLFGEPEWHHAGKLPKSYGGGMKKTYFLDSIPTKEQYEDWVNKYNEKIVRLKIYEEEEKERKLLREKFAKKYGTPFHRVTSTPKFSAIEKAEMNGKYGWFESNSSYNLTTYYSGISFKSQKTLEKYIKI